VRRPGGVDAHRINFRNLTKKRTKTITEAERLLRENNLKQYIATGLPEFAKACAATDANARAAG